MCFASSRSWQNKVWRLAGILDPYSPSYSGKTLEEPSVIRLSQHFAFSGIPSDSGFALLPTGLVPVSTFLTLLQQSQLSFFMPAVLA